MNKKKETADATYVMAREEFERKEAVVKQYNELQTRNNQIQVLFKV